MDQEFIDGKLFVKRTPEEREPLLNRLRRIEGQSRGLQQMIEQDRYCRDELQQISAMISALREVAVLLAEQHVAAGIDRALAEGDLPSGVDEIMAVLRAALRQQ